MPMLLQLSKVLQAIAVMITTLVSIQALGLGIWSLLSLAVALLLLLSVDQKNFRIFMNGRNTR